MSSNRTIKCKRTKSENISTVADEYALSLLHLGWLACLPTGLLLSRGANPRLVCAAALLLCVSGYTPLYLTAHVTHVPWKPVGWPLVTLFLAVSGEL